MRKSAGILFLSTLVGAALPACAASGTAPTAPSKPKDAVLFRSYFVPLRPEVDLSKTHVSMTHFKYAGTLPGGQDGKSQLRALSYRYSLKDLAYQYSDAQPVPAGKEAVLQMGFGEQIQVKAADLGEVSGGALTANITITFGPREVFRRKLPFKPADCFLFAGRLDASLPILSVFSLEIRRFPANQAQAYEEFLLQARRDAKDFAPPPPQQRESEPYLPGVGDVSMPELVSRQSAVYPEAARAEKLEGQVIVEIVVDKEGKATHPRVITPPSLFDTSALEAATTYRYKPALKNTQPVSVTMNLIMAFKYTIKGP